MATDIEAPEAPTAEATKTPEQVFRFHSYVHVGPSAADCPHAEDGACDDGQHFHAFVRLPNQFQHEDIRQKALAAKARRTRALKDPQTDSCAILEADLDELHEQLTREPEATKAQLVDELLGKDWWKRQLEANKDVDERDEFEHIGQDRERLAELHGTDEDKRPAEEFDELSRHLDAYTKAISERVAEIEQPVRAALEDLDAGQLLERVRDERIASDAQGAFMGTYTRWQMFVGTLRPTTGRPHERLFADIAEMENEDPEVVNKLREALALLEAGITAGNA